MSGKNGYEPHHYQNAEDAVRLLHQNGVRILADTDANPGSFAPAVGYGETLHHEMRLLSKTGLSDPEVLAAATGNVADAFGFSEIGRIAPGKQANLLLLDERKYIRSIWVRGELL